MIILKKVSYPNQHTRTVLKFLSSLTLTAANGEKIRRTRFTSSLLYSTQSNEIVKTTPVTQKPSKMNARPKTS